MRFVKARSTPVSPFIRSGPTVSVETESKLIDLVTFKCPHCEGTINISEDSEGDAIFIHTLPFCDWFDLATPSDLQEAIDSNMAVKSVINRHIASKK
jgi:hypothetical protein